MKGLITGLELPVKTGVGRKPIYISDDARKLHHAINYTTRLLDRVARDDGFTYEGEKAMRSRLFQMGNALNANKNERARRMKAEKRAKTRARKRNPSADAHALLLVRTDGQHVTVCGFKPDCYDAGDLVVCDVLITECHELVDCPDCIEALR